MQKILKITKSSIVVIAFLSITYMIAVYPNDSRIGPPQRPTKATDGKVFHVTSSFNGKWKIELDIPYDLYRAKVADLDAEVANHTTFDSKRFASRWQSFVNLGSFPRRVEGRNGILVPSGHSVTMVPAAGTRGDWLEFGVSAFTQGRAELQLALDGRQQVWATTVERQEQESNREERWRKSVGRYLSPDAPPRGPQWKDHRIPLSSHIDALTFSCHGENSTDWCVVSEVGIYADKGKNRKNILFILVDTMRFDAVTASSAPNLHRRRDQFTQFRRMIAPGNMTSPSTNGILSCQAPSDIDTIAFSYVGTKPIFEAHYERNRPSFPYFFSAGGWDTTMIGNVSIISDVMGIGLDHGFKTQIAVEEPGYDTARLAKDAIQWLADRHDRPFFLYLHFHGPHAPYRAPISDMIATYPGHQVWKDAASVLKWLYAAEIHQSDRYIEQVLDAVSNLGLDENTIVVLTADHGDHHERRIFGENEAGPAYKGTYFDHGATLYNDEIRVPLWMRIPGTEPKIVDDWVSGLDIGPTLGALSDMAVPSWCAGISLLPYLQDSQLNLSKFRTLVSEGFRRRSILWAGRYKYIRSYQPTNKKMYKAGDYSRKETQVFTVEQLYDLHDDPAETNNIEDNLDLLHKIRDVFRHQFDIGIDYELVIENPQGVEVEVTLGSSSAAPTGQPAHKHKTSEKRKIFKIAASQLTDIQVTAGDRDLQVKTTSLRLPISVRHLEGTPAELSLNRDHPPPSGQLEAFVRKIESGDMPTRTIVTGNPKFQEILREWGYLNDG